MNIIAAKLMDEVVALSLVLLILIIGGFAVSRRLPSDKLRPLAGTIIENKGSWKRMSRPVSIRSCSKNPLCAAVDVSTPRQYTLDAETNTIYYIPNKKARTYVKKTCTVKSLIFGDSKNKISIT
jgi:hypothetical protein